MRATSLDLRKRVVAARIEDSQSMGEIADRFRIPKGTVQNILERYRDAGTYEAKPQNSGRKRGLTDEQLRMLEQEVIDHPDMTLLGLQEKLELPVSLVTVHHSLRRLGFTLKKNATCE